MFKKIIAGILDVATSFGGIGYLIAKFTGNTSEGGFSLDGAPALILFALVIAYFVIGAKTGGTIWQRVLGTKKIK